MYVSIVVCVCVHVCVYRCMCVFVQVCVCLCVCIKVRGQPQVSFLRFSLVFFCSLLWTHQARLTRWLRDPACFHLPGVGIPSMHHHAWLCM